MIRQELNKSLFGQLKLGTALFLTVLVLIGSVLVATSQISVTSTDEDAIHVEDVAENSTIVFHEMYLHVDQILYIDVEMNNGTGLLMIRWLDRLITRTGWSEHPKAVFEVDGFSNYTFWLETDSYNEDVTVTLIIVTRTYPFLNLFPIGVLILEAALLVILGMIPFDLLKLRKEEEALEQPTKDEPEAQSNFFSRYSSFLVPFVFLLGVFLFLSLTDPGYVHNDSVGGGLSGPPGEFDEIWNYVAWGYLDFADMVVENLRAGDFSYMSWAMIHGGAKNIGLPLLVGFISYFSGVGTFVVYRAVVRVFFVVLSSGLGLIAHTLTRNRRAFYIGTLLVITNPILLEYSRSLYQEIPVCAMIVWSLYFLLRASQKNGRNLTFAAIFLGIASMFKSVLLLIPFVFGLFILLAINSRKLYWNFRYFAKGFAVLFLLGVSSLGFYFVSYPLRWTNPIGKLLGFTQSTSWVVTEQLMLLHNIGFLVYFLFFQTPLLILLIVFLAPGVARRYQVSTVRDMPLAILLGHIPFHIIETRLLQHHMAFSLWPLLLAATIALCKIIEPISKPSFQMSRVDAGRYLLIAAVCVNIMMVMPQAPYTGVYMNSLSYGFEGPKYFEPVYSLKESSEIIESYPTLGYLMTVRAPHVLAYYLPNRAVITPPGYLITQTNSLAA
ncbi:MAG: ArnT family glycosyltransferase, partial [Candidatus Hodarchaeota archaeon]